MESIPKELIEPLIKGEEAAYLEVVSLTKNFIFHVCLKIIRDHHDAEDVTQQVFLLLYNKRYGFDKNVQLFTWLYRSAVLLCKAKLSKTIRANKMKNKVMQRMKERNFERESRDRDDPMGDILIELNHLPPKYREILTMHFLLGKKYSEISQQLEMKNSTVAMRISRGLEALKKRLISRRGKVEIGLLLLSFSNFRNEKISCRLSPADFLKVSRLKGGEAAMLSSASSLYIVGSFLLIIFAAILGIRSLGFEKFKTVFSKGESISQKEVPNYEWDLRNQIPPKDLKFIGKGYKFQKDGLHVDETKMLIIDLPVNGSQTPSVIEIKYKWDKESKKRQMELLHHDNFIRPQYDYYHFGSNETNDEGQFIDDKFETPKVAYFKCYIFPEFIYKSFMGFQGFAFPVGDQSKSTIYLRPCGVIIEKIIFRKMELSEQSEVMRIHKENIGPNTVFKRAETYDIKYNINQ